MQVRKSKSQLLPNSQNNLFYFNAWVRPERAAFTSNSYPCLIKFAHLARGACTSEEDSVSVKGDGEKEASEHRHLPSIPKRRSHLFTAAAADAECPEG